MNVDASQLPSQSMLIGLGLLVTAAVALGIGRLRRLPASDVLALFGLSVVAAAAGSRVFWVMLDPAVSWATVLEHPMVVVDLSRGGHNSFGALGGATLAVGLWCRGLGRTAGANDMYRRSLSMLDALVPAGLAGLALARLGCLFTGCDFGRTTAVPWAVRHSPGTRAFTAHLEQGLVTAGADWSVAVHPFGAYLAAGTLLIVALAVVATAKAKVMPGRVAVWTAGVYLALRLVVEWTRQPGASSIDIAGLSVHQWFCVAGLTAVALMMWRLTPCSPGPARP